MTSTAFLDTNALYGSDFAATLLSRANEKVCKPKWSADILTELRRNLVQKAAISGTNADRRIRQMQRAFPRAEVKGYEDLVAKMTNDPLDRHVLAAAVKSGARQLVSISRSSRLSRPAATESGSCIPTTSPSCPAIPVAC